LKTFEPLGRDFIPNYKYKTEGSEAAQPVVAKSHLNAFIFRSLPVGRRGKPSDNRQKTSFENRNETHFCLQCILCIFGDDWTTPNMIKT
jgi:hypothetical protein